MLKTILKLTDFVKFVVLSKVERKAKCCLCFYNQTCLPCSMSRTITEHVFKIRPCLHVGSLHAILWGFCLFICLFVLSKPWADMTKACLWISRSDPRPVIKKWVPSESQMLNEEKERHLLGVPTSFLPCNRIPKKDNLKKSMFNWLLCFRAWGEAQQGAGQRCPQDL